MDKDTLEILRAQLKIMDEFMSSTVDPSAPHRDGIWWAGDLPAYPELYDPEEWEEHNKPVALVWEEYLYELKAAGLTDKLKQARELPVADLLAFSDHEGLDLEDLINRKEK